MVFRIAQRLEAINELSIAGKIAANPSVPSNRSSIHCSALLSARLRKG